MADLQAGATVTIARDIVVGGALIFSAGEQVVIGQVAPNAQRPEYKYTVFSAKSNNWFQLRDEDLLLPAAAPAAAAPVAAAAATQQFSGVPGPAAQQPTQVQPRAGASAPLPPKGKPGKAKAGKKVSGRTWLIVIGIILVLVAGGVAAYILVTNNNKTATPATPIGPRPTVPRQLTTPHTTPGTTPGTTPSTTPGSTPSTTPGSTPSTTPGSTSAP